MFARAFSTASRETVEVFGPRFLAEFAGGVAESRAGVVTLVLVWVMLVPNERVGVEGGPGLGDGAAGWVSWEAVAATGGLSLGG